MKAAVVSLGSVSSQWVAEEMRAYFSSVDMINLKEIEITLGRKPVMLYQGKPFPTYDCIYAKGSFRYAQLLKTLSSLVPEKTFIPIEPNAFLIGHDKVLTQVELQRYNVPMPNTFLSPTIKFAKAILKEINYPIVMKFPNGTQGKGVMFADSYSSAISILDALTALRQPFLIQEYVETGGSDIRVIVVGDKVAGAMMRKSAGEDMRSNIHAGGVGKPYELDDQTRMIAIKAAKAVGIGICGVDVLKTQHGTFVIEVNLSPGLQGITKATKTNVAATIAKYLSESTLAHRERFQKAKAKELMQSEGLVEHKGLKQVVSPLDFRGSRILLPELLSKISEFNDTDETIMEVGKKEIHIKSY